MGMTQERWKQFGIDIVLAIVGAVVGSTLGILFGSVFSEIFREILSENNPGWNLKAQVDNLGIELYSFLFVGLGWVGGFVVGGVAGFFTRTLIRNR